VDARRVPELPERKAGHFRFATGDMNRFDAEALKDAA
jgi:hypothetical protein